MTSLNKEQKDLKNVAVASKTQQLLRFQDVLEK